LQVKPPAGKITIAVCLALVALLFAGNFLWLRVVVQAAPPLLVQSVRFVVAGAVLYPFAIARSGAARPNVAQWRRAALVGALLVAVGQGCVSWAEQYIGAGLTVLVTCTIPIWVALLGALFFRERVGALALFGIVTGFAGLLPIVVANGVGAMAGPAIAALLVSAIAWAIGSLLASRLAVHDDGFVATGMQMLCGGVMLAAVAAILPNGGLTGLRPATAFSSTVVLGMVYLIIVGGILAYTLYLWLLRDARPAVASTFTYLQAIIGVTFGALLLHERVPPGVIVGGIGVIGGVACVVASRR